MKQTVLGLVSACFALAAAVGCGGTSESGAGGSSTSSTTSTAGAGGGSTTTSGAGGACTIMPTFAEVLQKPLISCAGLEPPCHKSGAGKMYIDSSDPAMTWSSIVNVAATIKSGGVRVIPGDPEHSFLYRKLTDDLVPGQKGPMPKSPFPNGSWTELPPDQIEMVRCWIQEGAPKK